MHICKRNSCLGKLCIPYTVTCQLIRQCYFSKIKPKRLTASSWRPVPVNFPQFAGLKEQAIGNPTLLTELQALTVIMEVMLLSATQKQGLGQQTAQFAFAKTGDKIYNQKWGRSLLTLQPSLLATRRGANIYQNRSFFSLKVSVNETSTWRKAISRDCFLSQSAVPHHTSTS